MPTKRKKAPLGLRSMPIPKVPIKSKRFGTNKVYGVANGKR
jgi:hypothetical protein